MTPHPCLPQTMTPENLAQWITENQKDIINHVEETELTEEEIRDYEHKSAMASGAIDELKEVEKHFKEILKKGTPTNGDGEYQPYDVTIPPTKGTEVLEANRKYANDKLRDGVNKTETKYYLIPFPEEKLMVAVDIEGQENDQYSREMTEVEEQKFSLPLLESSKPKKGKKAKSTPDFFSEEEEEDFN